MAGTNGWDGFSVVVNMKNMMFDVLTSPTCESQAEIPGYSDFTDGNLPCATKGPLQFLANYTINVNVLVVIYNVHVNIK